MRKIITFPVIVLFLVVIGCTTKPTVSIPSELSHATPFIEQLNKSGVKVQEVKRSVFESLFKETDKAAHIVTGKGMVEVVFFPITTRAK